MYKTSVFTLVNGDIYFCLMTKNHCDTIAAPYSVNYRLLSLSTRSVTQP